MKVLGAGLPKTGTTSLHRALGILGLRSLHYDDRRLRDVVGGSRRGADLRRYDDVDAVLDIPAACLYRELLAAYPEALCILTVRPEDDWWRSIESHFNARRPLRQRRDDPVRWDIRRFAFGSATAEEESFRERYRRHNEEVVRNVPEDRLLVMDVAAGHGWERLCPFLGSPEPAVTFPHQNRREEDERGYRALAVREIAEQVDPGASFVLVDDRILSGEPLPARRALPFLERGGESWGAPADDATAIREIERMRREGATHVVFAWAAFWWLDHYTGFQKHLRSRHRCVIQNDRVVVFDLRP